MGDAKQVDEFKAKKLKLWAAANDIYIVFAKCGVFVCSFVRALEKIELLNSWF